MNKKLVWTIIFGIAIVFLIILAATHKNNKTEDKNTPGNELPLPDTNQAQYNALSTSNDDFVALDDAINNLA